MGIYVSSVDEGSVAEKQGFAAGDQICSVNGTSFKNITQDEAVKVNTGMDLRGSAKLTLKQFTKIRLFYVLMQ